MNIPEICFPFLDNDTFLALRPRIHSKVIEHKKARRIAIGPDVTVWAESPLTIWWQIQEMVRVEGGGMNQVHEELVAYRPLIPYVRSDGNYFFTVTLMVEIPNPKRRMELLEKLVGLESCVYLKTGQHVHERISLNLPDNTTDKTSSVHFLGFVINMKQLELEELSEIGINHTNYQHSTKINIKNMMIHAKEQLVF